MALTDSQVRKAQPRDKDYKLADSGGLYLFVTKRGFKSWRFKYRFGPKEKRLVFGPYPEISLAKAREARDDARRLLREHRDPATEERKKKIAALASAGATFEVVARRWYADQVPRWSKVQTRKVIQAFERDVFPDIGLLPLPDISGPTILHLLRKIEHRGAIDTAKRIRQHISAVFQYGMAEGLAEADPAAGIKKALKPLPPNKRLPAVKSFAEARELLKAMDASTSGLLTKCASRLLALTAVRPGVVRAAEWREFEGIDWDDDGSPVVDPLWRIPPERMKLDMGDKGEESFEHVVPLPRQAVELLRVVRQHTGTYDYLFTSVRSTREPMSENTICYLYARNGYSGRHVPHGWRATFSTVMNERAVEQDREGDRAIIDAMLAHKPKGISASEMAYNRALHWKRRREIANEWADLIMEGLAPAAHLMGDGGR
ncbi:MAG: integrase arm-type DNA-binding domain-containing protein [Sphingobium sp.]|uniref:tyrosine-type recombinase/integrase n=1 Tax=Edaphosphingomonas haloaromaticamans TaxID=653954 RepID=UPI0008A908D6|nr:integrase arm-type DNA-binding domain-containing protein [Sphingomonas haloaromaticamans]MDX3901896.1 integrase arm-type DNA-binding domain-containing protein [Sphingobium sp.]